MLALFLSLATRCLSESKTDIGSDSLLIVKSLVAHSFGGNSQVATKTMTLAIFTWQQIGMRAEKLKIHLQHGKGLFLERISQTFQFTILILCLNGCGEDCSHIGVLLSCAFGFLIFTFTTLTHDITYHTVRRKKRSRACRGRCYNIVNQPPTLAFHRIPSFKTPLAHFKTPLAHATPTT